MALVFLIIPALAAILFLFLNNRLYLQLTSILASFLILLSGIIVLVQFSSMNMMAASIYHSPSISYFNNIIHVDALSMLLIIVLLILTFCVSLYSVNYIENAIHHKMFDESKVKLFYSLLYLFIFTMLLTLSTGNLGILWISLEATTLSSAFLVGFSNNKTAIEASWKYIIICSVGIAISLLGIIFLNLSSSHALPEGLSSLDFSLLMTASEKLDPTFLKFAFIFILVGFGTKAGLAPMHTWLPDAYSQAPSPVSALLSGSLSSCSMYGIMRIVALTNRSLGENFYTGRLLIAAGILSTLTAALFIITQKDYKRLLAYSSIEHMGIIAFSLGIFSNLSLFAAFYHMTTHSLTKALAFLSSGNIYLKFGTREIKQVRNLAKILPFSGSIFLAALLSLGGLPPFGTFISELYVFSAAFKENYPVLGILMILLIVFVFIGILSTAFSMFKPKVLQVEDTIILRTKSNLFDILPLVLLLLLIIILGLYMPDFLRNLILQAVGTLH
jgi:hydrogenase-4 component F